MIVAGCSTNAAERREQATRVFQEDLRNSWVAEDEVLGYRDIRVADASELAGLSGAELGRFLELHQDGVRLIPVFSFHHNDQRIEIIQGYRGRGQYAGNTDVYQAIESPFRQHRDYQRIYRQNHAFVFIDGTLAWALDQDQLSDFDRLAIDAWPLGAPPYSDGFDSLMARLERLRLNGPARFARFVNPPGNDDQQPRLALTTTLTRPAPTSSRTVFTWPQGWLDQAISGYTLEPDEINRLSTYPGELRTIRVGDRLPAWPSYYEQLPERYELVQRFPAGPGYALVGIKVTPSFECTPYGNDCGLIADRRYWIGVREGVVEWIDLDLPPIRDNHLHAWSVRDRVCAYLQASEQGTQGYCR
ncbi:hypothetical protein [Maricaulis sp.]|uniref:hypothetical protein n=1 Tax=Maricaulis sp. TaxID=1486257 RepID=UPI0026041378|nr:hypothetical protein [Maricaulis sp.]